MDYIFHFQENAKYFNILHNKIKNYLFYICPKYKLIIIISKNKKRSSKYSLFLNPLLFIFSNGYSSYIYKRKSLIKRTAKKK